MSLFAAPVFFLCFLTMSQLKQLFKLRYILFFDRTFENGANKDLEHFCAFNYFTEYF